MNEIDWDLLRARAVEVMGRAYAPYSGYPVGAAALVDDGRVVAGCNVENAAYGVTLCAECGLVSDLVAGGGGRLLAFTCCNANGDRIMPCGRCRQLLWEHGGATLLVDTPAGVLGMAEVLPQAFGPEDLSRVGPRGAALDDAAPDDAAPDDAAPDDAAPDDAAPDDAAPDDAAPDDAAPDPEDPAPHA